jgi:hypothetical protein
MYEQLIATLLKCSDAKNLIPMSAFSEWIQDRDSPYLGRPMQAEDISNIECTDPSIHLDTYIGATPLIIACNVYNDFACRVMLDHMSPEELHLDHVWTDSTALIIACENGWMKIAEKMLHKGQVNVAYMPRNKRDAIYYASLLKNQSLLREFFIHMVDPEQPDEIHRRAFQLIQAGALKLDSTLPRKGTLFMQIVNDYYGDNVIGVLSDILFPQEPFRWAHDHLDLIPTKPVLFWHKLILISIHHPAFVAQLIRLPPIDRRLKTDGTFFSTIFVSILDNEMADESLYMIQLAVDNNVPHFVNEAKYDGEPVLEMIRDIVESNESMRPVANKLKELDEIRGKHRMDLSARYYQRRMLDINKNRHNRHKKLPVLPEDVDRLIASYVKEDDGRRASHPLVFGNGRRSRGKTRKRSAKPKKYSTRKR